MVVDKTFLRFLAGVKGIKHPLFVTDDPTLKDHLPQYLSDAPNENSDQDGVVGVIIDKNSTRSGIKFPEADSYAITAQATYLLSRVFEYTRQSAGTEAHNVEGKFLDETILAMAVSILRQAEENARFSLDLYCTAYGVCLV